MYSSRIYGTSGAFCQDWNILKFKKVSERFLDTKLYLDTLNTNINYSILDLFLDSNYSQKNDFNPIIPNAFRIKSGDGSFFFLLTKSGSFSRLVFSAQRIAQRII